MVVFFVFSGMIPRLLGDILLLWICNLLAHLINTYAINDSVYSSSFTLLSSHKAVILFFFVVF